MTYHDNTYYESAEEALLDYTTDKLRALLRAAGERPPTRKADLVDGAARLLTGDELRRTWAQLTEIEQAAVAEVVHGQGNTFDPVRFHAKYGELPDTSIERGYHYGRQEEEKRQGLLPLFFYGFNYVLPASLKDDLAAFVPKPRSVAIQTAPAIPPKITHEDASPWLKKALGVETDAKDVDVPVTEDETLRPALHYVTAVLRLVDAGRVSVSAKTRRVTLAGAKAILEVLHSGDFLSKGVVASATDTMRPFAWPLLIQSAKLVSLSGSKLKLRPAGRKALAQPAHETLMHIMDAWAYTDVLDEFSRINEIKGQSGRGKRYMTDPAERREAILDTLRECPVGEWVVIDEFFRYMRASGHDFCVTSDPWRLYVGDRQYGNLGYGGGWAVTEGRYTMVLLWEYLATLGIVDVAHTPPEQARNDWQELWGTDGMSCLSRYDGLLAFRINALGAYCLGITDTFDPPEIEMKQAFTVTPNMEIVVTDDDPSLKSDMVFLGRFCEPVSERVWKLTRKSVLAAVEQGQRVSEIIEFLSARSGAVVPDNVNRFLEDMGGRAGRLVGRGRCHLIEADDPHLAQLIANDSRLAKLCLPAGDRHLAVPEQNERAFRTALRDLGYVWAPTSSG